MALIHVAGEGREEMKLPDELCALLDHNTQIISVVASSILQTHRRIMERGGGNTIQELVEIALEAARRSYEPRKQLTAQWETERAIENKKRAEELRRILLQTRTVEESIYHALGQHVPEEEITIRLSA